MAQLKDSGNRRNFDSGAVRDISEGKGRCDLLPLDIVGDILEVRELCSIESFKRQKDSIFLQEALRCFADRLEDRNPYTMFLEVSKHYEDGARKYSENNWKKGIPLHCYIDSGVRHLLKYLRGDTDEPHDRAFVWNMLGAMWTLENKPELDDIEKDLYGETDPYKQVTDESIATMWPELTNPIQKLSKIEEDKLVDKFIQDVHKGEDSAFKPYGVNDLYGCKRLYRGDSQE